MQQDPSTQRSGGKMIFAPAIGIVSFQILGGLSFVVSVLCSIGIIRQWLWPTETLDIQQLLTIAIVFGIGGILCLWASRKIRSLVSGD
jgi:hypothetical protein